MDVIITSFGSDGDFNPLLAIAAALIRRGVTVTFVANPFYERRIRNSGSRFVAAGKYLDVFATLAANPQYFTDRKGLITIWRDLTAPNIRETYPVICKTIHAVRPAAVVAHFASFAGAWAAISANVPHVTVTTGPSVWLSRHHPTVFANWRAPRIAQAAITLAMRSASRLFFNRTIRHLADAIGAPDVDTMLTAALNLAVWPAWFRPPAPDDPPRSRMCGFVFDYTGTSQPLPPGLQAFLANGDPPVIAAFGSAASLHASARYRAVADACARLGRRCLLIGPSADRTNGSTTHLMTVASAPYASVFPYASVIVHHGGFGTCGETLRAGKPSLVTPFAFDQFDTAARLHDAHLGHWMRNDASNVELLTAALASTLRDASLVTTAREAAIKIVDAPDGADHAASLIAAL